MNKMLELHDLLTTAKPNECLIWQGASIQGYGVVYVNRRAIKVHRIALSNKLERELVEGECACHTCDTPLCFNPYHLWVGSRYDNAKDRDSKGRGNPGKKPHRLNNDDVAKAKELRRVGFSYRSIAKELGVHHSFIHRAIKELDNV